MPIGGERVGEAYVRIYADGSSIPGDIRDELQRADDGVRAQGEEHGSIYAKEFEKGASHEDIGAKLRKQLEKSIARGDLAHAYFDSDNWHNFRRELEDEFGEAGAVAAAKLESSFREKGTTNGLDAEIKRINTHVANAVRDLTAEEQRQLSLRTKAEQDWLREFERINRDTETILSRSGRSVTQWSDDIRVAYDHVRTGHVSLIRDFEKVSGEIDSMERHAFKAKNGFIDFARRLDRTGYIVGKAFGRGSRNNFLNFTGVFIGGIVKMTSKIPELIGDFESFTKSIGGGGSGGGAAASLRGAFSAAASTGLGLVITIGAVVAALSLASSLVSGLAAAVVALAGSIAFALVGAVGALAGSLLPVAAGIGIIIVGIANMTEAQKKLVSEGLKPVKDAFHDVGKAAADGLFSNVAEQGQRLADVLRETVPLAHRMGNAISDVGDKVLDALQSNAWDKFIASLEDFLPRATRLLGDTLNNIIRGFAGVFRALEPLTLRFLGWLRDITDNFADWANTPAGQKALLDFFERAGDSAQKVGQFIVDLGEALGELFSQGRESGDNLFQSMSDSLQSLTDYLRENPDAVKQWFEDGVDIARSLGDAILDIASIFNKLEDPDTRKGLVEILDLIGKTAIYVGDAAGKVLDLKRGLEGLTHLNFGPFSVLTNALLGLPKMIVWVTDAFGKIGPALSGVGGAISGFFQSLPGMARGAVNAILGFFSRLPGRIGGALRGVVGVMAGIMSSIANSVATGIGRTIRFFLLLPHRIRGALQQIPGAVAGVLSRLPGIAAGIVARTGSVFAGLVGRIARAVASIPGRVGAILGRLTGIATSVVGAVARAFGTLQGRIQGAINGIPGMIGGVFSRARDLVAAIPGQIVAMFQGLGQRIINAIGPINIHVNVPDPGSGVPFVPGIAAGAYFGGWGSRPMLRWVMEDGPEAIVPLNRPLGQVDPAVRGLSAIAQGKAAFVGGGGKTVDASGWVIQSNSEDPYAVAKRVINDFIAMAN